MKKAIFMFLIVVLIISAMAQKYPDLGLKAIGAKVGPAIPDSPYKIGFAFGVYAELGKLHRIIASEATIEYMRVTKEVQKIYTNAHSDLCLILTLKLLPEVKNLPFQPYLGGGVGFHYLTDTPDQTLQANALITHKTRPELHIAIGATYPLKENIDAIFTFKVNLSDISTYNPYLGVSFSM